MAQEFKIGRLRFTWSGPWTPGTQYAKDSVVSYQGKTYACLLPNTSSATSFYNDLNAATPLWSLILDGKTFQGAWTTSTFYSLGNIVIFGGVIYYCNLAHTSTTFSTDASKWTEYTQFTNWRIVWNPSTSYGPGDLVRYGGIVYQCITSHTSAATVALGLEANQSAWIIADSGVFYTGAWTPSTRYKLNDIIRISGNLYICITYHTSGLAFSGPPTNWSLFIPDETFGGAFSPSNTYQLGDVVQYGGYLYTSAVVNNLGYAPSTDAGVHWTLLVPGSTVPTDWVTGAMYYIGTMVRRDGNLYQAIADNISQDPTVSSISATYNSTGSSGTTVNVNSTTSVQPGAIVIGTGFSLGQTVVSVASATQVILNYAPDGTLTNNQTINFVGINSTYWKLLNSGQLWTSRWITATAYNIGDIAVYKNTTYSCIQGHTASALNRPDVDVANQYWIIYVAHFRKNAMSQIGDIETYNNGSYTAVPVGTSGYVLRNTNSTPTWAQLNTSPNVFYVSTTTGVDAIGYGASWDRPFKTIAFAANRVNQGILYPSASALLQNNKVWIQAEAVAWTNYQIANNLSPYSVNYPFDATKTARDIGYIIDALAYDLARGGNSQTVATALAYFQYGSTNQFYNTAVAADMPYYLPIHTFIAGLFNYALSQTAPVVSYQTLQGVTNPVYQTTSPTLAEAGTSTLVSTLFSYITTALTNASTSLLPTTNQGVSVVINVKTGTYYETLPIVVPANCAIIGDELRGVVVYPKTTVNTTATSSSSTNNLFTVTSTAGMADQMPVQFMAPSIGNNVLFVPFGNIAPGQTYYITGSTLTSTQFGIQASPNVSFTGTMSSSSLIITDVSTIIGLAVGATLTGLQIPTGTTITGISTAPSNSSLSTITISQYPTASAINMSMTAIGAPVVLSSGSGTMQVYAGDCLKDMFRVRNGTGVRNMTLTGLQGTLLPQDAYGIQRCSGGSYCAFDPATGPNDSSSWITRRSPFFVNVTCFGNAAAGAKIDGNLHNGGNKSMVFNDFTQLISDGIGIWCTGPGSLTECISVFCYYGYAGYFAENGGRIRAANGNSSYGAYGVIAEGYDLTETPITGTIFNQSSQVQASVQSSLGASAQLIKLNYANAGSAYYTTTTNLIQYSNNFTTSPWANDSNVSFDKIFSAPTSLPEAWTMIGTSGAGGVINQIIPIIPAGASYTALASTTLSGIGSGATFNVTVTSTAYIVTVSSPGINYTNGNQVKITGNFLGGTTPANDLILTVNSLSGSGISTVVSSGTVPVNSNQSYTYSVYVYQGTATTVDIAAYYGNNPGTLSTNASLINFNFSTNVITPNRAGSGYLPIQYGAQTTLVTGWYRIWFAFNDPTAAANQIQLRIYPKGISGTTGQFNYFYGAQLEKTLNIATGAPSFYLETQATQYTSYANYNISGSGVGAVLLGDETRSNGVFQSLVLTGGAGYLTASNNAQGGTSLSITLAQSDVNFASNYVNMRVFIPSGTGAGQYGYISSYNPATKQATVLRESFNPLQIASTSSVTGAFTLSPTVNTNTLFVGQPVQFIPTYYTTTVNSTSLAQTTVTVVTGGVTNTLTVSSTAGLTINMAVTFTGTTFSTIVTNYVYYVYAIIDQYTLQISTQAFGTVLQLVSATGSMTMNFTSGTSYLQASTANMVINYPIQFTGTALGGVTIGLTYYINDIIDPNNFTISPSLVTTTVTATNSANNTLFCSNANALPVLNPIIFTAPAIPGSGISDSTKYYISSIVDSNDFTISASLITQSVTATTITTNAITTTSTTNFVTSQPVIFTGTSFGGIQTETTYYILTIINSTQFTVSQTQGGGALTLQTASGNMVLRTCPAPIFLTTTTGNSMVGTTTSSKKSLILGQGAMNAQFSTSLFGNVTQGQTYYITGIPTTGLGGTFTVSTTVGGSSISLLTKTGTMNVAMAGWDHVTSGFPILLSLDSTTVYYIEPRLTYTPPNFYQAATTFTITLTTPNVWQRIAYGSNYFIAIPSAGILGATSLDGITWSSMTLPINAGWTDIAYGNGVWVAINSTTSNVIYSNNNGLGWRVSTMPRFATWSNLAFGNGIFVAFASGTVYGAYSTNYGYSWTQITLPTSGTWVSVAFGAGVWSAVASGTNQALYSTNGITWVTSVTKGTVTTQVVLPTTSTWSSMTWGNGRFVAVASDGSNAAYSFDGINWNSSYLSVTASIIKYGQGSFLALSNASGTAYNSENGLDWVVRAVTNDGYTSAAFGFQSSSQNGVFVTLAGQNVGSVISSGIRTKGRPIVVSNTITGVSEFEPGSGYISGIGGTATTPTIAFTDPNITSLATVNVRTSNGVLGGPSFVSKGSGYSTTTTQVYITGNGYADTFQTGLSLIVNNLTALPSPGANLTIAGNTTQVYKITSATAVYGTSAPTLQANIAISPTMTLALSPTNGAAVSIRVKYSQARLTNHDFLNIGYGDFVDSQYPGYPLAGYSSVPQNQTIEANFGRVFVTSTDQDGNFKVGNLFGVQQATGIVTLSASQFGLSGLSSISIGGIAVGGSGVIISQFSTDGSFTANSDNVVPTQKAIRTYLNSRLSQGGSNTFTGQLTAGTVVVGGPNFIRSSIPNGQFGSAIKMANKINFQQIPGNGAVNIGIDGNAVALDYFIRGGTRRSVPPLTQ